MPAHLSVPRVEKAYDGPQPSSGSRDYDMGVTMSEHDENSGGALRQQLEEALKANKELKSKVHDMTVAQLVSDKGLDKRIAKLVPSDTEDIGAWLDENADLFASVQKAEGDKIEQEEVPTLPPVEAPEGASKVQKLEASGVAPESALEFQQRMAAANSPEELTAVMNEAAKFFLNS